MTVSLLFPGFVPSGNFGDVSQYQLGLLGPKQLTQYSWNKGTISLAGTFLNSYWLIAGQPGGTGATPSTAAVPINTTTGALDSQISDSLNMYLAQMELRGSTNNDLALILCDRLSHQGGLSGIAAGAQTTNLPTAALTRYTSGVGVHAALEIYSAIGTGGATATVSYTNQNGSASGQVGPAVVFGTTASNLASRFIPLPLASGDTGVTAVASVTLSGTSGTAGNFGVTLYKPLAIFPLSAGQAASSVMGGPNFWDALYNGCGNLPQIQSGACLFWLAMGINAIGSASAFGADPVILLA